MKRQYLLGFLILLTTTIGMFPGAVYANEAIDSDGDGVPNSLDQCPNLLEDYDPQYGNNIDGCPADFVPWYDADYDGIEDHVDNCPTVKETYNKFQDDDGCPDLPPSGSSAIADSDNDGYPDYMDLCPNRPETFNGIDDKDGCPDNDTAIRDADRDGISDNLDACPLDPETYNKFQDDDGCPDTADSVTTQYQFPDT
ncbi:MAG: thrombospondin type 3 repeat-containing protein, partial [Nitrosopumilus sp.]|nr:thrombospondin type 3 repeat-containing protein [Nitrosopumilus sp.]